jgi:hypothetical protein
MEVKGRIKVIGEVLQVTDSYKKRDLVITTDEQYPQHISIEFAQDKTSLLDNRLIGEEVKVSINIGGREWTNPQGEVKYFNSIKGWRIEKLEAENQTQPTPEPQSAQTSQSAPQPPQNNQNTDEEKDDLPF